MGYELVIHSRASDQLADLHWETDERIRSKIREMANDSWREIIDYDVKRIQGVSHDIYRTRVGGYRVFFLLKSPYVAILHVDDREGAYNNVGVLDERADIF